MFPFSIEHSGSTLLSIITFTPLIGALLLCLIPSRQTFLARAVAVVTASATFTFSILALLSFSSVTAEFQLVEFKKWLPGQGINYALGVDGISIWLLVLTTFLSLLVIANSGSVTKYVRAYLASLLILETGMLGTFLALDGLLFYVFWELMLIPMYFLIGIWGGERRLYAAIKFVLFTAFGSLLMLVAIVYLGYQHFIQFGSYSFLISDWSKLHFAQFEQILLFSAFTLAFVIKIPLFPFHTWLPDAHVEAPTGGSVILAGVLLKMGLYGLIRFGIPVFPEALILFQPLFIGLGLIGIVYGALMAWVQTDIKKLIAYSSVSHLGFCMVGFSVLNFNGMQGCLLQMINHGISTGALFFIVGVLYDRKHTREIVDYSGLADKVPVFAFVYLVVTLSSIGLPLTNGFVGEFLIMFGGFEFAPVVGAVAVTGVILGAIYMLSLYRRLMYGELNARNADLPDLYFRELVVFVPLLLLVFVIGVYPTFFLSRTETSSRWYVDYANARKSDPVVETVDFDTQAQMTAPGD